MKLLKSPKVLLAFASILIAAGLWFSGTNTYTFAKGYLLYKAGASAAEDAYISELAGKTGSVRQVPDAPSSSKLTVPEKQQTSFPPAVYSKRPDKGALIGELHIPKLDATLPIYHGTEEEELSRGVGHYAGSVLPGQADNSVLSGHRDTVFRELGEVGENDVLIVTTEAGEFEYTVKRVRIVDAEDRTVIVPKPRATLTVSTCYPFDFLGNAPDRYVLVAELSSQTLY